ncbi:MAG: hypothetical protein H7Y41_03730 [Hyphomonadaceae bacterium]|nr:hypothetical protein [Clostridia bacterium]
MMKKKYMIILIVISIMVVSFFAAKKVIMDKALEIVLTNVLSDTQKSSQGTTGQSPLLSPAPTPSTIDLYNNSIIMQKLLPQVGSVANSTVVNAPDTVELENLTPKNKIIHSIVTGASTKIDNPVVPAQKTVKKLIQKISDADRATMEGIIGASVTAGEYNELMSIFNSGSVSSNLSRIRTILSKRLTSKQKDVIWSLIDKYDYLRYE